MGAVFVASWTARGVSVFVILAFALFLTVIWDVIAIVLFAMFGNAGDKAFRFASF